MKKKLLVLGILFISSLSILAGCAKQDTIIGVWNYMQDNKVRTDVYYTFNNDNTGSYTFNGSAKNFTYTVLDNKVVLEYEGSTIPSSFEFVIENGILTIKDSFGADVNYKKK